MATQLIMKVDGPFSLAAAASFGFGPNTGRPYPDESIMRLAFVADDLGSHAGAVISQQPDGSLLAEVSGDADPTVAAAQIRRILSVDTDVTGWLAAGQADPVLGGLQAKYHGLRPVLFHSPYEAAVWAILSQRRRRAQAMVLRKQLAQAVGVTFELAGQVEYALPLPHQLMRLDEFPGIEEERMARLRGVAQAAYDGYLDVAGLRPMPADQAMALLQRIKGLGPLYAMLVYLRATGVTDGLALGEPRLAGCLRHYYGLASTPGAVAIERLAEPWRPFRTWAGVLFRVAGDRDGLPYDPPSPRRSRSATVPARQ
jgi:DNA-3-methyladenine glycosylase II